MSVALAGSGIVPSAIRASISEEPAGSGGVLIEERTQAAEPGDHERFSHYVRKEQIVESAVTGKPVVALCGKVWVPSRDPSRFPVCPECREIFESLPDAGAS